MAEGRKQSTENLASEKDNTSLLNVEPAATNLRKPDESKELDYPEGGWGWVVMFASFWTNGTLFGVLNTFGILYVKILDEFQEEGKDIAFKCCEYELSFHSFYNLDLLSISTLMFMFCIAIT